MTRVVFMVLDGLGVGALPDAAAYGDAGSDTLGNLSRVVPLRLPFLQKMGLGNIVPITGVPPVAEPLALTGRLDVVSAGKDSTVGHWEHMGLVTERPFPTYPDGFPDEVLRPFAERIGREVLGNRPASGTEIIQELGALHVETGEPIVYTSQDSVFQIAAHVGSVPLERLYEWCQIAREILRGRHAVARVIARPFVGEPGAFVRTKDRRDFSLEPPGPLYLDLLRDAGVPILALGKIKDIYLGRGISAWIKVASNDNNLTLLRALLARRSNEGRFDEGLLITNLIDFDTEWGHRNDVDGFAAGLAAVDAALPGIVDALEPADMLIITADHGTDPTTVSTDHSREYVPLLVYPRPVACPAAVYESSLSDTGATVFAALTGEMPQLGGAPVTEFRPSRGWRPYAACCLCPGSGTAVPSRVGPHAPDEAAAFLRSRLGDPPEAAVILGSGLAAAIGAPRLASVAYRDIPFWSEGQVAGHPYRLALAEWGDRAVALLEGRLHGYEGFDLGELQVAVRTLSRWGVRRVLLTSSCGGVASDRRVGDVVLGVEVLDFQMSGLCGSPDGAPQRIPATSGELARRVAAAAGDPSWLASGVHVSVPGPQYETGAELEFLRSLGGTAVSMSGAPELLAAREEGLEVATLSLIVNAGHTSHGGVLAGAEDAAAAFSTAVGAVLNCWGYG